MRYQFSLRLADESGGELNVGVSGEDAVSLRGVTLIGADRIR